MNVKPTGGTRLDLQNSNLIPPQIGKIQTDGDKQIKPEPYSGGTLRVEVYKEDMQKDFVWRGLYKHAEAAGLPHAEAVKYADAWAQDKLMHQANGKTNAYTAKEFARLKQEGASDFDLNEQYSPQALNDLRQRQTAYRASLPIAPNAPPSEMPSMSAPQYNNAEQAVNWLTDTITSATGTDNEIGKQFNRLSVSTLHLLGQVGEIENAATEKVNDAIRAVTPDAIDNILDKVDQTNRENAQALKNANLPVTNNDRMDDVWAAKNGITRPLAEDLHRKLMYFPEGIPNAVDSAIKGDFKEDDGSYSDKVGKVVGGLNPIGDVRDIIANGKGVIEGKNGAWIGLGASIVGAIPIVGDGGKIVMKAEKEVIAETVEKLVKQGVEKETAEKIAKEEVGKLVKEAEAKIAKDEANTSGKLIIENGRSLSASEKEFADKMVGENKVVKARVESTKIGEKNPDFEIDGEIVEFKYVSDLKGKDVDTLSGGLSRRILDGGSQASKVSLNVTNQTGMTKEIAERAIKRAFGNLDRRASEAIKEVRIYGKDFDITIPFSPTRKL